jgi:hypothetical protein
MKRFVFAAVCLAAVDCLFPSVVFAAGDGTVAVPIGDWVAQATTSIASLCVAALSWVIARWAPTWVRTQLTEQLLSRAVDYALGAVAGAAKGKVLDMPIANAVLREAATYAVAHAPTTAKWIGDTLEPKLIARLSAAGALPAVAYFDPGLHPSDLLTAPSS